MGILEYILFGVGCVLNFYLSFLRHPIYRLSGGNKEEYELTGAPMLGSLFMGMSLLSLYGTKWVFILGLTLIFIDIGGLHWFIATMFYFAIFRKNEKV